MNWILIFWLSTPGAVSQTPVVFPKTYESPEACISVAYYREIRNMVLEPFVGYEIAAFTCSMGGR